MMKFKPRWTAWLAAPAVVASAALGLAVPVHALAAGPAYHLTEALSPPGGQRPGPVSCVGSNSAYSNSCPFGGGA
jgi:hypothetical protein